MQRIANMSRLPRILLAALYVLISPFLFSACPESQNTVGEQLEDAGESVKENTEEAAEEVEDEIDDAT